MMARFIFPQWTNHILPVLGVSAVAVPLYATLVVAYGFSPKTTDAGYQPLQPVPYSHALHAGTLGIDCRYCHNTVETAAKAAIPPTQTCMNCHTQIHRDSPNLEAVRVSYDTGLSVPWTRVHDLPDFAYFDHSAHVTRGVSCVECHGRVDKMDVVYQQEPLSMGWCLNCHRDPVKQVRDPKLVTQLDWALDWSEERREQEGARWVQTNDLTPSQDCSVCHR
jgi:hypothetical protein